MSTSNQNDNDEVRFPIESFHTKKGNIISIILDNPTDTQILTKAHLHLLDKLPKKLYCYCSFRDFSDLSRRLESLIKEKIWLSNPEFFNDPFDGISYHRQDEIKKILETQKEGEKTIWDKILKFIGIAPETRFSDDELNIIINTIINRIFFESTTIRCFSSKINEPLLWGHYADGHKGYVLAYDTRRLKETMIDIIKNHPCDDAPRYYDLFPVVYDNKRYDASQSIADFISSYLKQNKTITQKDILKLT